MHWTAFSRCRESSVIDRVDLRIMTIIRCLDKPIHPPEVIVLGELTVTVVTI